MSRVGSSPETRLFCGLRSPRVSAPETGDTPGTQHCARSGQHSRSTPCGRQSRVQDGGRHLVPLRGSASLLFSAHKKNSRSPGRQSVRSEGTPHLPLSSCFIFGAI
ncbi:hypothetical protein NDU88_002243 [Pleurodeles waltl]|uniref:Uncharacterized protein n=1 Tax=Pleurodeles waltl TaxID=8319 RepID=A0AAV7QB48_PLEWA|nr:hypothetical protein NDU88_002243 [Pleurodeles waltl]